MRIAYVINSVEGGGAAFPVPAIAAALQAEGADIEVFALTRRDGRAIRAMAEAGLRVHVRDGGEKDHFAAYRWLRLMLARFRPDAIWTSLTRATLLGQFAGAALKVPVVSWQHAAFLLPANRRLLRLRRDRSALWVADSHSVAAFSRAQLGIGDDRLVVWPIFAANPDAPQGQPWREGEPVRIGSLGRLHPVKGYDVLLEALGQVDARRAFTLTIGGTGAELNRLKGATQVAFAGFVDDPAEFLAALHLYVQPSRSEGFCVAAHEAMQAGLPVIGSAVGEMAWSIDPGVTGMLVEPGDLAGLASAISDCIGRAEQLHSMGAAGRARLLQRFSREAFQATAGEIVQRLDGLCRQGR